MTFLGSIFYYTIPLMVQFSVLSWNKAALVTLGVSSSDPILFLSASTVTLHSLPSNISIFTVDLLMSPF